MSIKFAILALLAEKPRHGYEIKNEFDRRTNHTWPLNIGQVYTTLDRLERDGLCYRGDETPDGRVIATISSKGREEVRQWFATPVAPANPPRNELAIKIALAATSSDVDVAALIQEQRHATMHQLQEFRQARRGVADDDLAGQLLVDGMIFAAEAEIRWLDHCESKAIQASHSRSYQPVEAVAEDSKTVQKA
ncbi:PadR family transcriptional regulator [Cutibacterium sp. WCA-380-WT-3A]|uniref:PadR family transcriptional regulator n=1 Tax=Cutibacterium porci TaxID=2605781 RepID=A0A7K0J4W9_9ACTN|nr:PadR family transcriptional regulator [Cutibacterium porci]MSS44888.1 PadR family transcriptional regulator [Cutibacterium porci]